MDLQNIILELSVIFTGAAILATIFLYLKQPVILSYITLGIIVGPLGLKLISDPDRIEQLSHFGVILLLFLLGLQLQPAKLVNLFKKTSMLTIGTSLTFVVITSLTVLGLGAIFADLNFTLQDSFICGGALMFSSTVVSLKLIPTTTLHHKHKGEMMTSVLLFQDILAIVMILLVSSKGGSAIYILLPILLLKVFGIIFGAFVIVKYTILPLFRKFDVIQEYIFVLALGWCLIMAEAALKIGLSYEMGAFIAGLSIASSPIAWIISEKLKPIREFFLILFFFSIGTKFDFLVTKNVVIPGLILATVLLVAKPIIFKIGFRKSGEPEDTSKELGFRLGQASEFSLLLVTGAVAAGKISIEASYLVKLVTILTFIVSTYVIMQRYPTPISNSSAKRAD